VDLGRSEAVPGGLQTPRTIAPATRVPGSSRGGHARHRSRNARCLLSGVPARDLSRQVAARWRRCGYAPEGQRNRHRLVPACSGARAPLAGEDRRLVRVCPRVVSRLQKSASVAKAQRSAYPVATGRVDGGPAGRSERVATGPKASRPCRAVAKPRSGGSPEPGARKGAAGRGTLPHGRHPGPLIPHAPLHAGGRAAVLAALTRGQRASAGVG